MTRQYETIFILKADLDEEKTNALVEKFTNVISTAGTLDNVDKWGKKKLAYPIDYKTEGYYVLANFSSSPDFPHELERLYKITEDVLKYIVIKKD